MPTSAPLIWSSLARRSFVESPFRRITRSTFPYHNGLLDEQTMASPETERVSV